VKATARSGDACTHLASPGMRHLYCWQAGWCAALMDGRSVPGLGADFGIDAPTVECKTESAFRA